MFGLASASWYVEVEYLMAVVRRGGGRVSARPGPDQEGETTRGKDSQMASQVSPATTVALRMHCAEAVAAASEARRRAERARRVS